MEIDKSLLGSERNRKTSLRLNLRGSKTSITNVQPNGPYLRHGALHGELINSPLRCGSIQLGHDHDDLHSFD